jgi:nucleoside-diphosphate-sugar epimerase
MKTENILITGACGQIGSELTALLREKYGKEHVVATDLSAHKAGITDGIFEKLDVLDAQRFEELIQKYEITQIYHLAAILSAKGEQNPLQTWHINMDSLLQMFEISRKNQVRKIFWPSSIAVFSRETPAQNTPQHTFMYPSTVYGISKLSGEYWCKYYFDRYGLDIRSIRYPGIISYKTLPGGGTTDYAVDIYFKAKKDKRYECFLNEKTYLPMIYMPDALRATLELMDAPAEKISIRTSYNLSSMSFSPKEIAEAIRKHIPDFEIQYAPDFRQAIADSWPDSIDDSQARQDWNWKPEYDLDRMTADMIANV